VSYYDRLEYEFEMTLDGQDLYVYGHVDYEPYGEGHDIWFDAAGVEPDTDEYSDKMLTSMPIEWGKPVFERILNEMEAERERHDEWTANR